MSHSQPKPPKPDDRKKRKHRWAFRILSISLGMFAAMIVGELSLMVLGIGFPSFYTPDFFCGSRLRPNTRGEWITEGHGRVSINSLGFRGPEFAIEKPGDVLRIAVLGDSMIEAMQVDHPDTFCAQLQQQLAAAIDGSWRIEVVNCGVAGYGTAQELLLLQHYVMPMMPDLVLLSFFPQNDIRNNHLQLAHETPVPYFQITADNRLVLSNAFRKSVPWLTAITPYEQAKAWLTNHSRVLQVLKQAKLAVQEPRRFQSETIETHLQALYDEAPYIYQPTDDPIHAEAIQVTGMLLQEVAKECANRDIPLVIFSASSPLQVYPTAQVRLNIAGRNGIDDLLYSEKLAQRMCGPFASNFYHLATAMQHRLTSQQSYYHGFSNTGMGLGHWNENGHATAARLMAEYILDQQFFRQIISARRNL